ncbi:MAG: NUDIX hydrolase [Deltaproteobacteria bacterium]|nr:NUDIX hydrolase [Deltaproteobacteria bacterium]
MIEKWPTATRELLVDAKVFRVYRHTSRSPRTGKDGQFTVIDAPDWVNVIPLTTAGDVLMIRQYRHGNDALTLEIPGGMVDAEDRDAKEAAGRELREETGYLASTIEMVGEIEPNPAIQNNRCSTFLATDLTFEGEPCLDDNEDIEIVRVPLVEIPARIASKEIQHALVVVAFTWFFGFAAQRTTRT